MKFKAVLLDLGDTLFALEPIDVDGVRRRFAEALVNELGSAPAIAETEAARVLEGLTSDLRKAYGMSAVAEPSIATIAKAHAAKFGTAGDRLAVRLDELFGEADVARFRPGVDCAAPVRRLKESGLRVGVVSNTTTSPAMLTAYLEQIGVAELVGAITYSVEVGFRKPHESIYRHALEGLGVEPEDAVFVGDRVREDVLGPQALGMEAVLTHEFRQEPPGESQPLAVIRSLFELLELLG